MLLDDMKSRYNFTKKPLHIFMRFSTRNDDKKLEFCRAHILNRLVYKKIGHR